MEAKEKKEVYLNQTLLERESTKATLFDSLCQRVSFAITV
jgi:hypothetical protein